jgi:predicted dehydrogenase
MATTVAVLGAGFMGSTHARAYGQMRGVTLAAIYAKSGTRAVPLAEELDSRWSNDLDAILADPAITAVDICLPSLQHREVAEQALAAGKHVLLEKPIAMTRDDGAALVELAAASDRVFMIAHVVRFWPEYVEIRRRIDAGDLGTVRMVNAIRRQAFPAWSEQFSTPGITGGAILDQMIHDYDVANWFLGDPRAVTARGLLNARSQQFDQTQVLIEYANGSAVVDGGMMMPESYPFTASVDVIGDRGALEYRFRAGGRSFENGEPLSQLTWFGPDGDPEIVPVDQYDPFYAEAEYFLSCVRNGTPADRATPASSLAALEVALAATESAARGGRIVLQGVG